METPKRGRRFALDPTTENGARSRPALINGVTIGSSALLVVTGLAFAHLTSQALLMSLGGSVDLSHVGWIAFGAGSTAVSFGLVAVLFKARTALCVGAALRPREYGAP